MEKNIKKAVSTYINAELLDTIKDIVYWSPNSTLSSFIEDACREKVKNFSDIKNRENNKLKRGKRIDS